MTEKKTTLERLLDLSPVERDQIERIMRPPVIWTHDDPEDAADKPELPPGAVYVPQKYYPEAGGAPPWGGASPFPPRYQDPYSDPQCRADD